MKKRKGQVWVETVIYTMIAFIMIGLVLSFVKPKIEEIQDKAIIEQSTKMLKDIEDIIISVRDAPGNQRTIDLNLEKGILKIDSPNDDISFELTTKYDYSQENKNVSYGNIIVNTQKIGDTNIVTLKRDYSGEYNITYQDIEEPKTITKSSRPYKVFISNKGFDANNKIIVDTEVV